MTKVEVVIKNPTLIRLLKNLTSEELEQLLERASRSVSFVNDLKELNKIDEYFKAYKGIYKDIFYFIKPALISGTTFIQDDLISIMNYGSNYSKVNMYNHKGYIKQSEFRKAISQKINSLTEDEKYKVIPFLVDKDVIKALDISHALQADLVNYVKDNLLLSIKNKSDYLTLYICQKLGVHVISQLQISDDILFEVAMINESSLKHLNLYKLTDEQCLLLVKKFIKKANFKITGAVARENVIAYCVKENMGALINVTDKLPTEIRSFFYVLNHSSDKKINFSEKHMQIVKDRPSFLIKFTKKSLSEHLDFILCLIQEDSKDAEVKYVFNLIKDKEAADKIRVLKIAIERFPIYIKRLKNPPQEILNIAYRRNPYLNPNLDMVEELAKTKRDRLVKECKHSVRYNKGLFLNKRQLSIIEKEVLKDLTNEELLKLEISDETDYYLKDMISSLLI